MARNKRTIRASEIGSFIYCRRAWWYQRKKIKPINVGELAAGQIFHQIHINQSRSANLLKAIAWFLVIAAVILCSILIASTIE
ncbi:MAG: hypothetical protein J7K66_04890 [Anaerolineaceae bacterium]|nr:hypothetical protein [Anaerolineaceae bacterium]